MIVVCEQRNRIMCAQYNVSSTMLAAYRYITVSMFHPSGNIKEDILLSLYKMYIPNVLVSIYLDFVPYIIYVPIL